jgi:hypothetical protein
MGLIEARLMAAIEAYNNLGAPAGADTTLVKVKTEGVPGLFGQVRPHAFLQARASRLKPRLIANRAS